VWLYSVYARDSWNVNRKLTVNYGFRWEYFPLPTRSDRGIERYDPATNSMLICGTGSIPTDCGVDISKRRFAPRVGIAYRATETFVIRAGYGITNDPFNATELLRANYPVLVPLNISAPNSFSAAGRIENGIPVVPTPPATGGSVPVPSEYAVGSVPQKYNRGYIESWNITAQKQLALGLVGQAGYVATRSIRQLAFVDINAGQVIGAGEAGQPLNQRFGRTAATTFSMPVGTGHYDALQATLDRRFAAGLEFGIHYTWSKSIGYTDCSDCNPNVQALGYWNLNRAVNGYDRTHNLAITNIWQLPFGKGKKWFHGGAAAAALGGWQVNSLVSLMTGPPFTVGASGDSLDLPGSNQRADQVVPKVAITHKVGADSAWFDPLAFRDVSDPRFGTSGFNTMRGPGLGNWDFGLFREFRVTERWRVQFRAEAFNFTNTPHFATPNADASSLQLGPNNTIQDLGGFATITGTSSLAREGIDERQFRFGLRIAF
jgi:TonB dependent receptor